MVALPWAYRSAFLVANGKFCLMKKAISQKALEVSQGSPGRPCLKPRWESEPESCLRTYDSNLSVAPTKCLGAHGSSRGHKWILDPSSSFASLIPDLKSWTEAPDWPRLDYILESKLPETVKLGSGSFTEVYKIENSRKHRKGLLQILYAFPLHLLYLGLFLSCVPTDVFII